MKLSMHGDLFHHNLFIAREKLRGTLKSEIIRVNLNAYSLRAVRVQKYIVTLKKRGPKSSETGRVDLLKFVYGYATKTVI